MPLFGGRKYVALDRGTGEHTDTDVVWDFVIGTYDSFQDLDFVLVYIRWDIVFFLRLHRDLRYCEI